MTSSIQPGFTSLISDMKDKFTTDGSNMITNFLEEYTANFVKGAASGKVATTLMGVASAGFAEVELPIAAIGALINEGFNYFTETDMKDDYKPGDVCLYFAGYWPVTPEEEAGMAMEMVDTSFEPLAEVPKYEVCVVVERLEGEKGYLVYDLAQQSNHTVLAKDLRPEQGNSLSKFDVIQKIKEKFTSYVKPYFTPSTSWKKGQHVYLSGAEGTPDLEGNIESINPDRMWIQLRNGDMKKITNDQWHRLLTSDEIEGMRNITQHGRSDLRVQQICWYHETPTVMRPCIIIQLKPKCLVRAFHIKDYFAVDPTKLIPASSRYKTQIINHPEYETFWSMVLSNPFNTKIPLVTQDKSLLYMEDDRKTAAYPAPTWQEEEEEIIPASIETRQYGTIPKAVPDEEVGGTFYTPGVVLTGGGKRQIGEYVEPAKKQSVEKKDNSTMLIIGAVAVLGGILLFNK